MVVVLWIRVGCALCALLLTWLSAHTCAAQHDARATVRGELGHFSSVPLSLGASAVKPNLAVSSTTLTTKRPWLWAAASTTAALAASWVVTGGWSYKASSDSMRAFERSRDFTLDYSARANAREQGGLAQQQAALLSRVSDICLAGTVAATGATLLIWLTGKRTREEQPMKSLIGPMLLRGANGGGLVYRNKF
ncbi:MAG: hypothetical protein RLZZ450_1601 [Pseudomonadota bacterium]|jgi:hypothetical protein